jgi:hypothetical protein
VTVQRLSASLFHGPAVSQAAQDLRRRQPVASGRIDVPATIALTTRRGGWLTPVPARARVAPEYLALVDRASFADHQARLFDELLDRLAAENVPITRIRFDGDPRLCELDGPSAVPMSPHELAGRFPSSRLILLGDGSGLIDPRSGAPAFWAEAFQAWPERAILTPGPADHWGSRELALAQSGWVVLPAGVEALAALADRFSGDESDPIATGMAVRALPPWLRRYRPRGLDRRPPPSGERDLIVSDLRRWLDPDGFAWLAACAIYPALRWDITLELGYRLKGSDGHRMLDLARLTMLARLPWFRHGSMPDWLRLRLIRELDREHEHAARAALCGLFLTALDAPTEGAALEIGRPPPGAPRRWSVRALRTALKRLPEQSPLREYIFATFLTRPLTRRLSVALPRVLSTILLGEQTPRRGRGVEASGKAIFARKRHLALRVAALSVSFALGGWLATFLDHRDRTPPSTAPIALSRKPDPVTKEMIVPSVDRTGIAPGSGLATGGADQGSRPVFGESGPASHSTTSLPKRLTAPFVIFEDDPSNQTDVPARTIEADKSVMELRNSTTGTVTVRVYCLTHRAFDTTNPPLALRAGSSGRIVLHPGRFVVIVSDSRGRSDRADRVVGAGEVVRLVISPLFG